MMTTGSNPLTVLLLPEPAPAVRRLRTEGWRVIAAKDPCQLRRLIVRARPDLVVVHALGEHESGWLTAAKLSRMIPRPEVLLVDPTDDLRHERLARFVGAVRLDSEHPRAIARAAREYAPAGV